ncbi:hypothetical protein VNO77_25023 [Canavalia gladiata]|uniref:Uncharacterized protein n=1 Tax=Canavalia gladiata TaxID=3824 RepID=A0AAN9L7D0_CANGL
MYNILMTITVTDDGGIEDLGEEVVRFMHVRMMANGEDEGRKHDRFSSYTKVVSVDVDLVGEKVNTISTYHP